MPKTVPAPDEVSAPFWSAANERRLVVQRCASCRRLQYPFRAQCLRCGAEELAVEEVEGCGRIVESVVIENSKIPDRAGEGPFNLGIISLDADPEINFYSNLPGIPLYEAPVGARVEVVFEEVTPDQLVPEWRVVA